MEDSTLTNEATSQTTSVVASPDVDAIETVELDEPNLDRPGTSQQT